jgi:sugar lactone lactonase YvrE
MLKRRQEMFATRRFRFAAALALGLVAATLVNLPAAAEVLASGNLPGSFGLRFGPDGRLYACTLAGIAVLDLAQGQLVDLIGPERGVSGFPEDVIFGPDGSMYWSSMFAGSVGRMAPDGTVTTQMIGPGVNSLVFSPDGRLFVTEPWITDSLWELDPDLVDPPQPICSGLGGLKNMEFGPDGLLYGALMWAGQIVKLDIADPVGSMEVVADGIPGPFTARFGPDGMLYVVERTGFTIQRMDPSSGSHATYAELPFGPDNIAIAPNGLLFVSSYTDGVLAMVMPEGSVQEIVPGGLIIPCGIAVSERPDGESVFVGNLFSLREYDGATGELRGVERFRFPAVEFGGAVSVANAGDNLALSMFFPPGRARVQIWDPTADEVIEDHTEFLMPMNAIGFGDDLIVVDLGMLEGQARVVRVGAGGSTVLADAGDQIYAPLGLAASADDLWVGDWATGMIWQLIADGQELPQPVPIAQGLSGPEGMAVDRDGSLLVVEGTAGRVSRVRPQTGAVTPVVGDLLLSMVGEGALPPFGAINGIAVGPSGAVYVAGDLGNLVYRLVPRTLYLPGAANTPGFNGSRWTTNLELHNRGEGPASYTVELLLRGQSNIAPAAVAFQLAPESSVRYRDAVGELFGVDGAGALRVTAVGGELLASAHTRTEGGGGFYGQYIEAMDEAGVAGEGVELRLIHLEDSAGARTNIGAVSACSVPITIDVALFEADGTPAGEMQLELEPFGTDQFNDLFGSLGGKQSAGGEMYAVVSSATSGALFFSYASVVDNGTNDPIFVPGR